jgi:anhydro-N-acetylmuramic acid kinase
VGYHSADRAATANGNAVMTTARTALGLMSGTSMDGIDAATLRTDGRGSIAFGARRTVAYDDAFRARLRGVLGGQGDPGSIEAVAAELTRAHADLVKQLLAGEGMAPSAIDVIGFHGHTILHRPDLRRTWQIGDGALLAKLTGIDVIDDFRGRDVESGGEGAPLAPLYHAALCRGLAGASRLEGGDPEVGRPVAILNLGGVANVTWVGSGFDPDAEEPDGGQILAFDTGPGNALLDDWARTRTGRNRDQDGALALAGRVDRAALDALLEDPYFHRAPPKSLDRDAFDPGPVGGLSDADGAATLTAFSAAAVARALAHLPAPPRHWLVSGGGRHNPALMAALAEALAVPVRPVEAVGWDGDALEAEAFAYLAVRSLEGLPLSLPGTTGVERPTIGGRLHGAER